MWGNDITKPRAGQFIQNSASYLSSSVRLYFEFAIIHWKAQSTKHWGCSSDLYYESNARGGSASCTTNLITLVIGSTICNYDTYALRGEAVPRLNPSKTNELFTNAQAEVSSLPPSPRDESMFAALRAVMGPFLLPCHPLSQFGMLPLIHEDGTAVRVPHFPPARSTKSDLQKRQIFDIDDIR